jgi:hypothetical protein
MQWLSPPLWLLLILPNDTDWVDTVIHRSRGAAKLGRPLQLEYG